MSADEHLQRLLNAASSRASFAEILAHLRERSELSIRVLAEQLKVQHGFSRTTLSDVLQGKKPVPNRRFITIFAPECGATEEEVVAILSEWDRIVHTKPPAAPEGSPRLAVPEQRLPDGDAVDAVATARAQHLKTLEVMSEVADMLGPRPGAPHPSTHGAEDSDLRTALQAAHRLYERLLSGRRDLLGASHEQTMTAAHNLGVFLDFIDDSAAACRVLELAYRDRSQYLGSTHPATLSSLETLAIARTNAGELHTARDLLTDCLAARYQVLTEPHQPVDIANCRSTAAKLIHVLERLHDSPAVEQIRARMFKLRPVK